MRILACHTRPSPQGKYVNNFVDNFFKKNHCHLKKKSYLCIIKQREKMKGYTIKIQKNNTIYKLTYTNKKDCLKYLEQCLERRTKALIEPTEEDEIKNFGYNKINTQLEINFQE